MALGDADISTRQRRHLAEQAIAQATHGDWEAAVESNRQILELGPDIDAANRLGKALAELGRHAEALDAYERALERDATNRIAQRNVERLRLLVAVDGASGNGSARADKAPATLFIEEMGKTGRARIINNGERGTLASFSPGDAVELRASGDELEAVIGGSVVGIVEPRVATRLLKLMADGNRYEAAITALPDSPSGELVVIVREAFTHPSNFGKIAFPTAAGSGGGVRPYMKGSAVRYDDDDETEEVDEETEEVEELDTTLPEFSTEPDLDEELVEEP